MSFIINILSTPAILVGLISLFGLILQKKPVEDVVKGTVKTIVGFLVLTAGSSFLQTGSLNDFGVACWHSKWYYKVIKGGSERAAFSAVDTNASLGLLFA